MIPGKCLGAKASLAEAFFDTARLRLGTSHTVICIKEYHYSSASLLLFPSDLASSIHDAEPDRLRPLRMSEFAPVTRYASCSGGNTMAVDQKFRECPNSLKQ